MKGNLNKVILKFIFKIDRKLSTTSKNSSLRYRILLKIKTNKKYKKTSNKRSIQSKIQKMILNLESKTRTALHLKQVQVHMGLNLSQIKNCSNNPNKQTKKSNFSKNKSK